MPTRPQKRLAESLRSRLRSQLQQAIVAGVAVGATATLGSISYADGAVEFSAPANAPVATAADGWAPRAGKPAPSHQQPSLTGASQEKTAPLPAPTLPPAAEAASAEPVSRDETSGKKLQEPAAEASAEPAPSAGPSKGGVPAKTVAGPLDRFRGSIAKLPTMKRQRADSPALGNPVVATPGDKVLADQAAGGPQAGSSWEGRPSLQPQARLTASGQTTRAEADDFRPSAVEGNWVAREAINRVEPLRDPAVSEPVARPENTTKINQFEAVRAKSRDAQQALAREAEQKAAQEKAAQDKVRREQQLAELKAAREAAEKAAQDKAARDKAAQDKAAQDKAAQDRAARDRAALERIAREKAELEEMLRAKAAEEKALLEAQRNAARNIAAEEVPAKATSSRSAQPSMMLNAAETATESTSRARNSMAEASAPEKRVEATAKADNVVEMVAPNADSPKPAKTESTAKTEVAPESKTPDRKVLPKRVASTEDPVQKSISDAAKRMEARRSVRSADIVTRRESAPKASEPAARVAASSSKKTASASVGDLKSKERVETPAASPSPATLDYAGYPSEGIQVTPKVASLRRGMERSLKYFYDRPEVATGRSNWGMMHSLMVYGADTKLIVGRKKYSAIAWIAGNNNCRGQRLLTQGASGIQAKSGVGLQGHQGQFLAVLGMCDVPKSYPLHAGKVKYDVAALIEAEKRACKAGEELTFTLIGLSHYIDTDSTWVAADGTKWDFERLIAEELKQPIVGAACGGTHRLMGYAHALRKRRAEGKPITGHWKRAEIFTEDFTRYAYSLQNRDGSMSTKWFEGRADNGDVDRKIQTTGHMVEWLLTVTPDDQLQDRRLVAAVSFLLRAVGSDLDHDWSIGPKGHALRSLAMYHQRVFKAGTPWIPSSMARRTGSSSRTSR